ncbi:hypothetical protein J2S24_002241 [Thermoanaerobacter pentosaceus]|uniref:Uncharacterized protein n=1 Tax=Thermoanaerobacter pentosaceus TaxID=694059 RepID=A0ABT9M6G3_9THEO|nr:hypothetical protein [Thermoanaerobacter pentosaceus]
MKGGIVLKHYYIIILTVKRFEIWNYGGIFYE